MGLLDSLRDGLFGRKTPIATRADLVDWLDAHAAFITQKGIHEYSRARAGLHWQAIYQEDAFIAALDVARWRAYPIGLAVVTEMVDGVLREPAGLPAADVAARLAACALAAFDRHPVFGPIGDTDWAVLRDTLRERILGIGLHPPKQVKDIPLQYGMAMFELMPMHPDVKQQDSLIVRSHLRVNLISLHRDFLALADVPALAGALAASAPTP